MQAKTLTIEPRTDLGKNASRRIRKSGFIPGVIYSHGAAEAIQIPVKEFFKLFKGRITESVIFDLHSSSKAYEEKMAYVKDFQMNPITNEIEHVDLFKVTATEKIHTHVPIEFIGTAKGIKQGGILEVDVREVEVECLPKDLPEKIQLDVSNMDIGDSIHVKDIKLGESIRLMGAPDMFIASVHIPKVAVLEEKVEEVAPVEGEGEAAKEAAEGEEGAKAPKGAKEKEKE